MERKTEVAHAFRRARKTYRLSGGLQQTVAQELCRKFAPFPEGSWLEVGCGTGFLTEELLAQQPDLLFVNDICEQMEETLPKDPRIQFIAGDGEQLIFPPVSMIASSFALQWFYQPIETIKRWATLCEKVIVALPIAPSFSEWGSIAEQEGFALTLNPPIFLEDLSVLNGKIETEVFPLHFSTPWSFLVWLKKLGANISLSGERVSPAHLRRLSKRPEPFQTQATVAFLEVTDV